MIASVNEAVDYAAFTDEAYDHLDGLGIFSASEIRAQLTGVRDPAEVPGPPRGYTLASAVLSGAIDYRTLPVIK
jgi:hypothetical protein